MYNIVDYAIVGIILVSTVYGLYQGGITSSLHTLAFFSSWLAGWIYYPRLAESIYQNKGIWDLAVQYLEGSKDVQAFVMTQDISTVPKQTLTETFANVTSLPKVLCDFVERNIETKALADKLLPNAEVMPQNVGQYFDNTVAMVAINVISFLIVVFVTFIVLTAIINMLQYVLQAPLLRQFDWLVGGAMGLLRGYFFVHCIAALVPLGLALVYNKAIIATFFDSSQLFKAYYIGNRILQSISGVI